MNHIGFLQAVVPWKHMCQYVPGIWHLVSIIATEDKPSTMIAKVLICQHLASIAVIMAAAELFEGSEGQQQYLCTSLLVSDVKVPGKLCWIKIVVFLLNFGFFIL